MAGYNETYLQGLMHMAPMAMNARRLNEAEQWHRANLMRQYQMMSQQERQRAASEERLTLGMQETMRHNAAAERAQGNSLEARLLALRNQLEQGNYQPVEDSQGNQWLFDARRGRYSRPQMPGQEGAPQGGMPAPGETFNKPKPLPSGERKKLEDMSGNIQGLSALIKSFKPEYTNALGETAGNIENSLRASPLVPLSSDMSNWWKEYQGIQRMPARHGISGATLTPREITEWSKADINPGMPPRDALQNMHIRLALLKLASDRAMLGAGKRYNRKEVESSSGMTMPSQTLDRFPDLQGLRQIGEQVTGRGETPPLEQIFGQ